MGWINKMGYGTIHFLFCFRNEVLRERHSTAKKLRRYYLQCLKQMLEEDRLALETSAALASAEEKMDKMKRALEAGSPGTDRTGERQEDVIEQIRKDFESRLSLPHPSPPPFSPCTPSLAVLRITGCVTYHWLRYLSLDALLITVRRCIDAFFIDLLHNKTDTHTYTPDTILHLCTINFLLCESEG